MCQQARNQGHLQAFLQKLLLSFDPVNRVLPRRKLIMFYEWPCQQQGHDSVCMFVGSACVIDRKRWERGWRACSRAWWLRPSSSSMRAAWACVVMSCHAHVRTSRTKDSVNLPATGARVPRMRFSASLIWVVMWEWNTIFNILIGRVWRVHLRTFWGYKSCRNQSRH